jgi:N6-adenosine-specific RNA methylase IME4
MIPFPPGRFGVLYADPPWPFKTRSAKGRGRSVDRHYSEMTIADICDLPVGEIMASDCVLFLWTTWPQLESAMHVIKRWGFIYKTCAFTWVKIAKSNGDPINGLGFWTRSNSEVCLLATHGRPTRLHANVGQVILKPRGRHSEKPAEVRGRIQRLVAGPYIELFARERVTGWTSWGNEV